MNIIEWNTSPSCLYNGGVECGRELPCDKCGWRPAEGRRRLAALRRRDSRAVIGRAGAEADAVRFTPVDGILTDRGNGADAAEICGYAPAGTGGASA